MLLILYILKFTVGLPYKQSQSLSVQSCRGRLTSVNDPPSSAADILRDQFLSRSESNYSLEVPSAQPRRISAPRASARVSCLEAGAHAPPSRIAVKTHSKFTTLCPRRGSLEKDQDVRRPVLSCRIGPTRGDVTYLVDGPDHTAGKAGLGAVCSRWRAPGNCLVTPEPCFFFCSPSLWISGEFVISARGVSGRRDWMTSEI